MIPILFASTETAFTSNGIGRLATCTRCEVTEERNGIFEAEFDVPITDKHYADIEMGCYILATHDDSKTPQPFEIYRASKPIDGVVTFNARHISYALSNVILNPFSASSASDAMAKLKSQSINTNPFTFWTDKSTSANLSFTEPRSVRQEMGGITGSILNIYGGEYKYDKWMVRLYTNRGVNSNVTIRYGKNLSDLTLVSDAGDVYNALCPYWQGEVDGEEVTVMLTERIIGLSGQSDKPLVMDFSGEFDEQPTETQLRTKAQDYLTANTPWIPDENIEIDFVQLWQTEEYKDVANLQRVHLCDTVNVYFKNLGVTAQNVKVIKTVYNTLLDRYDKMELGEARSSFAQTIMKDTVKTITAMTKGYAKSAEIYQQLANLQSEIDGKIQTWYQSADPSTGWTAAQKQEHIGDLWYDTDDGKTYRYTGSSWGEVTTTPNEAVIETIESKAQIFISQPKPPYYVGDLWFNSSSSDIMTCTTARATGNYTASDWSKRNKYTDDTSLTTFISGEYATTIASLNSQVDAKIETWFQSSDPATDWTTADLKKAHNGDLWCYTGTTTTNRTNKAVYRYLYNASSQTGAWNAYTATDDLFDAIDGKTTIFYGTPSDSHANVSTGDYLVDPASGKTYRFSGSSWLLLTDFSSDIVTAVNNATEKIAGGQGGYVVLSRNASGQPEEILIMDTPSLSTATNIIRMNQAGIGFSTDGGQTYRTAWLIDGQFNADFITAGTMSANRISGGTLILGGANNGNGTLVVKDASDATIGTWNNGGVVIDKGKFKVNYVYSDNNFSGSISMGYGLDITANSGAYFKTSSVKSDNVYYIGLQMKDSRDAEYESMNLTPHQLSLTQIWSGSSYYRYRSSYRTDGFSVGGSWINGNAKPYCRFVTDDSSFQLSCRVATLNGVQIATSSSSSLRYKHDIELLTDADLDPHRLLELPVKQFQYNEGHPLQYDDMDGLTMAGFIAEDVEEIYPSAVIHNSDGDIESWDERRLLPPMLALIQEQQKKIETLEERISRLEELLLDRR